MSMLYTARERARVDGFVAAIHRSSDCCSACCAAPFPTTDRIPTIVTTAEAGPEPAVLESRTALALLSLVGALVVLAAVLGAGLVAAATTPTPASSPEVVDLTSDTTPELAARGTR